MHLNRVSEVVLVLSLITPTSFSLAIDQDILSRYKSQNQNDQKYLSIIEKTPDQEAHWLKDNYNFQRQFDDNNNGMYLKKKYHHEHDNNMMYSPVEHGSKSALHLFNKRDLQFEIKDSGPKDDYHRLEEVVDEQEEDLHADDETEDAEAQIDSASIFKSKNRNSNTKNSGTKGNIVDKKSKSKESNAKKTSAAKTRVSNLEDSQYDHDDYQDDGEGNHNNYDDNGKEEDECDDDEGDDNSHKIDVPVKGPVPMDRQFFGDPENQPLIYEVDVEEVKKAVNDFVAQGKCKMASFLATAPSGKFFDFLEKVKRLKEARENEKEAHDGDQDDNDYYEEEPSCIYSLKELISETDSTLKEYSMDNILLTGGESNLAAMSINPSSKEFSITPKEDKILKSKAERRINILKELIDSDNNVDVESLRSQEFQYRSGNIYLDEDNEYTSSGASLIDSNRGTKRLVLTSATYFIGFMFVYRLL